MPAPPRPRSVDVTDPVVVAVRLGYREPCDIVALLRFLGAHAVPGVESWDGATYRRSLLLPGGEAVVSLAAGDGCAEARLWLSDRRDQDEAVGRLRRLLDLDTDPLAVEPTFTASALAPLCTQFPGSRVAGSVDGDETALRTLLGQQVSLAAARRLGGGLTVAAGVALVAPVGAVTHRFPSAAAVADLDPGSLPMPRARGRALVTLAAALADGLDLSPDADRDEAEAVLLALPGIGPWTARYVRMRALGDPDVLLVEDLAIRRAAAAVGLPADARGLARAGEAWRPWRSYASSLLWSRALHDMARP